MRKIYILVLICVVFFGCSNKQCKRVNQEVKALDQAFQNPPDSARPWVFWIWTNGNISKEGITADLEAMKRVGIGGALWYETGSPWWPPSGKVAPYSPQWYDLMQWSIQEAERLDLEFGMNLGYGYGAGGPHITPNISMQKLYWSRTYIKGGKKIDTILRKPEIHTKDILDTWLKRAGSQSEEVVEKLKLQDSYLEAEDVLEKMKKIDFYRDVAVLAIPCSSEDSSFTIPQLDLRSGLSDQTYFLRLSKLSPPEDVVIPKNAIVDLTSLMSPDGTISWDAPPGKWQIIRLGHASNFRMSRPVPYRAVGLECSKLSSEGINKHFETFLKPIFDKTGSRAGKTFKYVHIASWEDGPQNWTADFPGEFIKRRGYDIFPWLPVLTGSIVESPELSDRFLWDFRQTVSEMTLDNYHLRLRELASGYNIQSSREPYGNLCIDNLKYAETSDFPVSEFWMGGNGHFPDFGNSFRVKSMASVAHTLGKSRAGAEAFTYTGKLRSWKEHPFLLKGIGDEAFCQGINHFFLHLYCHQAYDSMKPGLTHRHAGGHFHRQNTWWEYSKPWIDYITRCQHMLQHGSFVADVIYFFGEGAPLDVKDMNLNLPQGYNYDVCSSDIIQQMIVRDGKIVLPSGMTYRYLLLPNTDRLTLSAAQKINELVESGAKIVAQQRITGTPGLSDYPEGDQKVQLIASQLWDKGLIIIESDWEKIFIDDDIYPDFKGKGLNYVHRKTDEVDIYFVANPKPEVSEIGCTFRISGKTPELWNPETGEIKELTDHQISNGQITIPLRFDPFQSWFVVFRKNISSENSSGKNFPLYHQVTEITGPWQVTFDPKWGGPAEPVTFNILQDWSEHNDLGIRYYSGTATYKTTFDISSSQLSLSTPVLLDLGRIEVMAKIRINGKECGIAWKPPYRVDISQAVQAGENKLEIDVVNMWANRMIGDEQLPEDCEWIDWQVLKEWPAWFLKNDIPRPSGRYTFTPVKVFEKDDPLYPSGLLGPARIYKSSIESIK